MVASLWCSLEKYASGRSLESGVRQFCVGVFGRNLVSVFTKMFSHLIYSRKVHSVNFDGSSFAINIYSLGLLN
jgi:hypothetical protein